MADTVYFFVCLILHKIYVKKIIVFLICKYKKYHLHGLSLANSKKGDGKRDFLFFRGSKFFCRGVRGFGLLITVKKPYLGEPLSIFFS